MSSSPSFSFLLFSFCDEPARQVLFLLQKSFRHPSQVLNGWHFDPYACEMWKNPKSAEVIFFFVAKLNIRHIIKIKRNGVSNFGNYKSEKYCEWDVSELNTYTVTRPQMAKWGTQWIFVECRQWQCVCVCLVLRVQCVYIYDWNGWRIFCIIKNNI